MSEPPSRSRQLPPRPYPLPAANAASASIVTQNRSQHARENDLSWLEFLRPTGGAVCNNSSLSTDRKRRYTGSSSPERRINPYTPSLSPASQTLTSRPAVARSHPSSHGTSIDTAIDLTTSPRLSMARNRPSAGSLVVGSHSNMVNRRGESDIVLPRWQSDSDVSQCPVCETPFGFWNRKHHCRKCGRVVCASCSPHRITIPNQYIVRPANPQDTDGEALSPNMRNLGGGETVRVCNPCVPDPWTPDTQLTLGEQSREALERRLAESREQVRRAHHTIAASPFPIPHQSLARQRPERSRYNHPRPPVPNQIDVHGARSTSHTAFSQSMPQGFIHSSGAPADSRLAYHRPPPVPPSSSRPIQHRHSQSGHYEPRRDPRLYNTAIVRGSPQGPSRPLRREVKEEDECPVCGIELPPGEQLREVHIQECVSSRFSSTPAQGPAAGVAASASPSSFATPPSHPDRRGRGMSFKSRGMAISRATEKDCTTASGEAVECVICFEEFQPGDELGRMECLCKFHRACIRQWWDTKGPGSCPTHQLQE